MPFRIAALALVAALTALTFASPRTPSVFADDVDSDKDGVFDAAESNCGGSPTNPNLRPERIDDQLAGRDDDGDTLVDEALPGGASAYDCDGDGFTGAAEANVFGGSSPNRDQDACGITTWPADFVSGGVPDSTNHVTITDLTSFLAPDRHLNTSPPDGPPFFDIRWDLSPGPGLFADVINISDLTALIGGSTGSPAMFASQRSLGGPKCPWPITISGYNVTTAIPSSTYARAVAVVPVPGSPGEVVLLQQDAALVWRLSLTGAFAPYIYGDLSALAGGTGNEEGLLAFAFAPGFPTDSRVYAYYTQGSPSPSILSRFTVIGGGINAASPEPILSVPRPNSNHNGGELKFGPDGYLYLSLGDAGGGGDPTETGQNNTDLLASVLRIDVSGATGYTIPSDNPFVIGPGRDEVWAYGLRNPWRYSFDSYTGDLWLGDVGQQNWEEIDIVTIGGNYQWDNKEGLVCYEPTSGCSEVGTQPEFAYGHTSGACAITGGIVYRGASMPELNGWYIYADYCNGRIWAYDGYGTGTNILLVDTPYLIPSFAEQPDGEILVVTHNNGVYRLNRNN
jgi:glucose/arabinose dehydrogenase